MRRSALTLLFAAIASVFCSPAAHAQAEPFLGQIMIVPYNFAPVGWFSCNGQLLSISQYTALFSLLGTMYGGDGITTFALPDLQGRAPIGWGQGPGLSSYTIGDKGGVEQVTLTLAQIPAHSHVPMGTSSPASTGSPAGAYWAVPRALLYSAAAPSVAMNEAALGSTGGGQPHDNMKPYLVLTYVIAYQGIFPSRP